MRVGLVVVAVVVVMALAACGASTDCVARSATVTGVLSKDILGTWDGFGVDSRVLFDFHGDGGVTLVEVPNQYQRDGSAVTRAYQVADGGVVIDGQFEPAAVTDAGLRYQDRNHPPVSCKGFGF
ncbi:MAG: hypothetical protein K1X89_13895 [Myxococcaceae bacterium]|nr:hypothetical protein [Myxococcaceae bacterium]